MMHNCLDDSFALAVNEASIASGKLNPERYCAVSWNSERDLRQRTQWAGVGGCWVSETSARGSSLSKIYFMSVSYLDHPKVEWLNKHDIPFLNGIRI